MAFTPFTSGEHPTAAKLNANFASVLSGATESAEPAAAAFSTASSAAAESVSAQSSMDALTTSAADVVDGAMILEEEAAAVSISVGSATSANSANNPVISSTQSALTPVLSAANAAEAAAVAQAAVISSINTTISAALVDAAAAISASASAESGLAIKGATVSTDNASLSATSSSLSSTLSATSAFSASIGATVPPLSGGKIPLADLPYTAGGGLTIVSGAITAPPSTPGTPDVLLFLHGIADTSAAPEYTFGIQASKGVASVTHTSAGCYTIVFSTPFANANWIMIHGGGFGGDSSGATAGDTTTWDNTAITISEHRGGEYVSRSANQVILDTHYITVGVGGSLSDVNSDIARISLSIWAAPSS
jgi:hypothetical protein